MGTFTQKQNKPQQQTSSNLRQPDASISAATHQIRPTMHLQRTPCHQAVQRFDDDLEIESGATATTRFAHDFSWIPVYAKAPAAIQAGVMVKAPLKEFPHASAISAAMGIPVAGCAVVDPEGCADRGVEAFTAGEVTHFKTAIPMREVAAHEAAHLAQHARRTRDAHLGPEAHAMAIEHAVREGKSARAIVGGEGAPVEDGVHDYTRVNQATQESQDSGK